MYKMYILWKKLTMLIVWKENVSNADIINIVLDIEQKKEKEGD